MFGYLFYFSSVLMDMFDSIENIVSNTQLRDVGSNKQKISLISQPDGEVDACSSSLSLAFFCTRLIRCVFSGIDRLGQCVVRQKNISFTHSSFYPSSRFDL